MLSYLWIAIGGALGTTARYWLSGVVAQSVGETFPWGTLVVFVIAAIVAGLIAAIFPARRAARLNVLAALQYE